MQDNASDFPQTAAARADEQSEEGNEQTSTTPIQGKGCAPDGVERAVNPEPQVNVIVQRTWDGVRRHSSLLQICAVNAKSDC